jgi:hypothetical protein
MMRRYYSSDMLLEWLSAEECETLLGPDWREGVTLEAGGKLHAELTRRRIASTPPKRARLVRRPQWLTERVETCRACQHWIDGRCDLHPTCTSCYRKRPGAVCPDEPPRWGPAG